MKKIQRALLNEIGGRLARLGFDRKPMGQSFRRTIPSGQNIFHITFINHEASFDVTGDVAVRVNNLEALVNKDRTLLSEDEKRNTASIGAELGNIRVGAPIRWTVNVPTDVSRVASAIVAEFEKTGLPYLQRYSNLDAILSALQPNDQASWLHSPIHEARCRRIVALTALMKPAGELRDAIRQCDEFLKTRGDPGLTSYRRFVSTVIAPAFGEAETDGAIKGTEGVV